MFYTKKDRNIICSLIFRGTKILGFLTISANDSKGTREYTFKHLYKKSDAMSHQPTRLPGSLPPPRCGEIDQGNARQSSLESKYESANFESSS